MEPKRKFLDIKPFIKYTRQMQDIGPPSRNEVYQTVKQMGSGVTYRQLGGLYGTEEAYMRDLLEPMVSSGLIKIEQDNGDNDTKLIPQ